MQKIPTNLAIIEQQEISKQVLDISIKALLIKLKTLSSQRVDAIIENTETKKTKDTIGFTDIDLHSSMKSILNNDSYMPELVKQMEMYEITHFVTLIPIIEDYLIGAWSIEKNNAIQEEIINIFTSIRDGKQNINIQDLSTQVKILSMCISRIFTTSNAKNEIPVILNKSIAGKLADEEIEQRISDNYGQRVAGNATNLSNYLDKIHMEIGKSHEEVKNGQ